MSVKTIIAGALLAAAPLAAATSATIVNNCAFDMYVWQIDSPAFPTAPTAHLAPKGQSGCTYTGNYVTNPDGGGVSMKIATTADGLYTGAIQQFEYTLVGSDLWYDISNINGNPLQSYGSSLVPNTANAGDRCNNLLCPSIAGSGKCTEAYNVYNDDIATHVCPATVGLTAYLCGGNGSTAESPSAPAVVAPPSVPAVVPSVAKPAPVATSAIQAQAWSAAPKVTEAPGQPEPVIVQMTTFATVTATAAPIPLQLGPNGAVIVPNHKRHLHEHANAHHHIH